MLLWNDLITIILQGKQLLLDTILTAVLLLLQVMRRVVMVYILRNPLVYHITLELVNRLDKSDFSGHTLTLKVKYADFTQVTRSLTCATPLTSKDTILPLAKKLLQKVEINASHPIRLMGLGVSLGDDKPQNKLLSKSKQEEPQLPFAEY